MNELGDEPGHLGSLPLRCHVSRVVDSGEPEIGVFSYVPREISVGIPGSLRLSDCEACVLNPTLRSIGGYRTIGSPGIMQYPILFSEPLVDPD